MAVAYLSTASANETRAYDWSDVINAIIMVESKGNHKAYNKNGDCLGILQITPTLVKECNQILEKRKSKKRYVLDDRRSVAKSKEMFVLLQEHFNKEHNLEKAIRCWNGGFYGNYKTKTKTRAYYKNVMRHYKKGS